MSTKSESLYVDHPLVWDIRGNDSPVSPDVNGILQLSMDEAGVIVVANGSVIKGIHMVWRDGTDAEFQTHEEVLIVIGAEPGGSIQFNHEELAVTANDRISTPTSANVTVYENKVQIWWQWDGSAWRWKVPEWTPAIPTASQISLTVNDPSWVDPNPTNVEDAINRIAARVSSLALGLGIPIP